MGTTDTIVDLDGLVMQAWKEKGIEATRQKVEARLIEERQRRLARYRQEGKKTYAWGYLPRKSLLTPVGDVGQACEVGVVGDVALVHQFLHVDGQRHETRDAGHASERLGFRCLAFVHDLTRAARKRPPSQPLRRSRPEGPRR